MLRRHELSDKRWSLIAWVIPGKVGDTGRTGADRRLFVKSPPPARLRGDLRRNGRAHPNGGTVQCPPGTRLQREKYVRQTLLHNVGRH
ncbi:MAG: hypothetical protein QM811_03720 [Pirellulales bacterium]